MATSTQPGTGISSKVKEGGMIGGAIGALFVIAGLFGLDLPDGLTEEWLVESIGVLTVIVTTIMKFVEYYRPERNPSASAIEAALATVDD